MYLLFLSGNTRCGCTLAEFVAPVIFLYTHFHSPYVQAYSNCVGYDDHEVQSVFDYHLLPIIVVLLAAPRDRIVLKCLWVIHNLLNYGSLAQMQTMLVNDAYGVVAGVMPMLSVWLTRAKTESNCSTAADIVTQLFEIVELLLDSFEWLTDIDSAAAKSGLAMIEAELSKEFYNSLPAQFYEGICEIKSKCQEQADTWLQTKSE